MLGQAAQLRVLIADQQPNVRQALWLVCEQGLGLTVVAEAANAAELLRLVMSTQPDILLLEWSLPGVTTRELIRMLHAQSRVIIIAVGAQTEDRAAALAAGVDYFAYKGDPPEKLLDMLNSAITGVPRDASQ